MTPTTILGAVASAIGSVMALSPLLQARLIRRTGSSRDVSLGALWIFVVNCVGWLAYGIALGNVMIVVPNVIALGALAVAITVAMTYRVHETRPSPAVGPADASRTPAALPSLLASPAGVAH